MNPTVVSAEPARQPAFPVVKFLLLVSLPLYVLDQVTKYLIWRHIDENMPVPVIPGWFDLVHVGNTGAAFGMMHNRNGIFVGLSLFAIVLLGVLYRYGAFADIWLRIGLFLLVPGILGNLTDRLIHGHVIDFLSFDLHVPGANPWPSFNVADSCICLAVACFLFSSFQDMFRRPAASQTGE